jgi:acetyl esterase/lipase
MKLIKITLALFLCTTTIACGRVGLSIANFTAAFSTQKITHNIDFGSNYKSKLDIYTPSNPSKNKPVIVFFYGGKWTFGNKEDYKFVAQAFTKLGYIVVIPDYIKYPKVKFPTWQSEGAKAVVWVHNNIAKYNGDNKKLFVMGHSAGAHIGALLATDNKYLKAEGGDRSWIKSFAGLAGPYNFTPEEDDLKNMFGPEDRYKYMNVTNYVDGKQAPMLLLWGKEDKDVGEVNILRLVPTLKKTNSNYMAKYYDNVDHIDILAAISIPARNRAPVIEDVDSFFKKLVLNF